MSSSFYECLTKILPPERILCEEPMKNHTTFRIGGNAQYLISPDSRQLSEALVLADQHKVPVTVIGNGSNLLVGDRGIRGLVVEIGRHMDFVRIKGDTLYAGAGTLLSKAAKEAAEAGLSGLEFAAGIPGSIGGAVVMNAGAYGGEIKDVLLSVEAAAKDGAGLTLSAEELELSYRHSSVLERGCIITQAVMKLAPADKEDIQSRMAELRSRRIEKQPLEYPSAGSTFKRPEGYFAGKLIMDAGLSGYTVGGAQVSPKHCGFVVNTGNATAADVQKLIEDVRRKVYERFQVWLEPEVKIIGE